MLNENFFLYYGRRQLQNGYSTEFCGNFPFLSGFFRENYKEKKMNFVEKLYSTNAITFTIKKTHDKDRFHLSEIDFDSS